MTRSPAVVRSVASVSFREILREKILYNILVIGILLMGLGFLASRLTFVRPDRVILDFGVSAVNLSLVAMGILVGSSLLNREVERRTIFLALSRPISRFQFVAGKYVGLLLILILNWMLVSGVFLAVLVLSGGLETHSFTGTLYIALTLLLFQSFVMAAIAMLFSSFSTTSLSIVLSTGVYLIGNNVSHIQEIAKRVHSVAEALAVDSLGFMMPNLEYFNLGTQVTYGMPVPIRFFLIAIVYSLSVSALSVALAGVFIYGKEA